MIVLALVNDLCFMQANGRYDDLLAAILSLYIDIHCSSASRYRRL